MSRVFSIGETVYDIIFKNNNVIAAKAGGAMLNTAVSLGRLGVEVYFISEFGSDSDPVGKEINDFLLSNQVNTNYSNRPADAKTTIALAFLNDRNNAEYSFYHYPPADRLNYPDIEFEAGDIVLFGSFFSITREIRPFLLHNLNKAVNSGAIIIYDPNFRKPHLADLPQLKPMIYENLKYPDIIRGSDNDFYLLFNAQNAEEAFYITSHESNANLIYTQNRNGVEVFTLSSRFSMTVPEIDPVSTIGAGDNFNAGIIWSILRNEITKKNIENLPENHWKKIVNNGIRFATDVCMSYNNYISIELVVDILRE